MADERPQGIAPADMGIKSEMAGRKRLVLNLKIQRHVAMLPVSMAQGITQRMSYFLPFPDCVTNCRFIGHTRIGIKSQEKFMPMQIEHIDAIARQKQRDVLFVQFHSPASVTSDDEDIVHQDYCDWENLPIRQQIIDWLEARNIGFKPCGHFANECLMMGYRGQMYIDVPFDGSLPTYQALQAFFEFPDGSMRFPGVTFCYCPLDKAMENAAHDEPGFWQRWAENF